MGLDISAGVPESEDPGGDAVVFGSGQSAVPGTAQVHRDGARKTEAQETAERLELRERTRCPGFESLRSRD